MALHRSLDLFAQILAGGAAGRAAAARSLTADAIAADAFAAFVERQGLRLFLHDAIAHADDASGADLWRALPPGFAAALDGFAQRQVARQEALVHELARIEAALRAAGIPPIALKGPIAAVRFHGGIDRRAYYDLDLLVRPGELAAAEGALAAAGLRRRSTVLLSRRLTTRFTHAFDYAGRDRAGRDFNLDLHWRLFPHPSFGCDEEAAWRGARRFALAGRDHAVLDDATDVRFSLLSLFRDLERGAARVKHLVDVRRQLATLQAALDWDHLLDGMRREGVLAIAVNAIDLALACLPHAPRLADVERAIAPHRSSILARTPEARLALLEATPGAIASKRWAARLYSGSRIAAAGWWAASLPFRLAVHEPGKVARLRRRAGRAARVATGRPAAAGGAR